MVFSIETLSAAAVLPPDSDMLAGGGAEVRGAGWRFSSGDLSVSLGSLDVEIPASGAGAVFGIQELALSPALQRLLLPGADLTGPPLSLRVESSAGWREPEPPHSVSLAAELGPASLNGTAEVHDLESSFVFSGRLDGFLAMLRSAGAADPQIEARELGLFYSAESAAADSIDLNLTSDPGFGISVNGRPLQ